jgi:hypothetical protein
MNGKISSLETTSGMDQRNNYDEDQYHVDEKIKKRIINNMLRIFLTIIKIFQKIT